MKKIFYLILIAVLPHFASAQLVVSDPTTSGLILKSNGIQAAIQGITKTSVDKLGDLGKLTKDLYNISKEYQDELQIVSNFVAKTSGVNDIFKMQKQIVDLYAREVMKYDKNLDTKQKKVYRNSMKQGVARSLGYLSDLDVVITSHFSKMTDGERLKLIEDIKTKMNKEYEGMSSVTQYFRRVYNLVEVNKKSYKYAN